MPKISSERSSKRVLDPIDRVSEVLFGLIMVLTFTGALSVAEAGREDVRTMLIGALGCNLAWGIIDGVLYLMGCAFGRMTGRHPWLVGISMIILGSILVSITIALGG